MAKSCIGLDIGPNWIKAVQVVRQGSRFRIQRAHSVLLRRKTDNPLDALKELTAVHGFDRRCPVAINLPPDALFQAGLRPDQTDQAHLLSPLAAGNALTAVEPATRLTVVRRSLYRHLLELVRQSHLKCRRIVPTARAIHTAALFNHPALAGQRALIYYEDSRHCFLLLSEQGSLLQSRAFPARTAGASTIEQAIEQELDQSWAVAFGETMPPQTPVYIASLAGDRIDLINRLVTGRHCQIIELDPFARVQSQEELRDDYTLCLCEGLALHHLTCGRSDGDNLLALDSDRQTGSPATLRRQVILAVTLAAVSVLTWTAGLLLQRFTLERRHTQLKGQISQLFAQTLPDEPVLVDAEAQLDQRFKQLEADIRLLEPYLTPNPVIDGWNQLQRTLPAGLDLTIRTLKLQGNTVTLSAESASEPAIRAWQQTLAGQARFANIKIVPGVESPGRFAFTLTLEIVAAVSPADLP